MKIKTMWNSSGHIFGSLHKNVALGDMKRCIWPKSPPKNIYESNLLIYLRANIHYFLVLFGTEKCTFAAQLMVFMFTSLQRCLKSDAFFSDAGSQLHIRHEMIIVSLEMQCAEQKQSKMCHWLNNSTTGERRDIAANEKICTTLFTDIKTKKSFQVIHYLIPSHHSQDMSCYSAHWCKTALNLGCCCIHCNNAQKNTQTHSLNAL